MKKLLLGVLAVAASALSAGAEEVADLIKKLKNPDHEVRRAAASALAESGSAAKPAIRPLIEAVKDNDLYVRRFAIQALGAIGPDAKEAIPALTRALDDDKKQVRVAAVSALGRMGPSGVPALSKAVASINDEIVEAAIPVLAEARGNGVPVLSELIKNQKQDALLRREAVDAVKKMGKDGKSAIPALIETMKMPKGKGDVNRLRTETIQALEVMADKGDRATVDALLEIAVGPMMGDNFRVDAMRALGKLANKDDTRVRDGLMKVANEDKNMRVKAMAKEALARMDGKTGKK
jgi:HEAT repeat protein